MLLAACAAAGRVSERPREVVELSVVTPDAGWRLRVRDVRQTEESVWIWAELARRPGLAAQQLTTVRSTVRVPAGKNRRVFVTGKTWAWANDEPYEFVEQPPVWPADASVVPDAVIEDGSASGGKNAP